MFLQFQEIRLFSPDFCHVMFAKMINGSHIKIMLAVLSEYLLHLVSLPTFSYSIWWLLMIIVFTRFIDLMSLYSFPSWTVSGWNREIMCRRDARRAGKGMFAFGKFFWCSEDLGSWSHCAFDEETREQQQLTSETAIKSHSEWVIA